MAPTRQYFLPETTREVDVWNKISGIKVVRGQNKKINMNELN